MPYPVAAARGRVVSPGTAAGPWSPADLASLVAWWDFSDATKLYIDAGTTGVTSDGQLIYQANDKSGNGRHALQSDSASRLAYKTAVKNGLSICRGADVNDFLRATFTLVQPLTWIVVWWAPAFTGKQLLGGGTGNVTLFDAGGGSMALYAGSVVAGQSYATSTWAISAAIFDGASSKHYKNGGTATTGNPAAGNPGGVTIMASSVSVAGGAGDGFACDIGEVICCNTALSTADLNSLGAYLATKWALTWSTIP